MKTNAVNPTKEKQKVFPGIENISARTKLTAFTLTEKYTEKVWYYNTDFCDRFRKTHILLLYVAQPLVNKK